MKKIILILIFLFVSNNLFANTLEYKGLEKLSKNNTFMNDKGKPYSIEEISDKKNSLVIIYNHGSIQDHKQDPCTYAWEDKKMSSDKGHNIPQSKCFTKYLDDKNYLISFLENILR